MELFDQWKQPEFMHVPEWFGPLGFANCVPGICLGDEGVMEMRDSGDVLGVTGQRACEEAALVVDEMDNDHFEDLPRKPGSMGWGCRRSLRRSSARKDSPDFG